jgi:hypothetical protein
MSRIAPGFHTMESQIPEEISRCRFVDRYSQTEDIVASISS